MKMDLEHVDQLAGVVDTATPDEGHELLRQTIELEGSMAMRKAVAIEIAHRTRAWEHDNGDYVGKYEVAMRTEGFSSMLPAYCWVEYGFRESMTWTMARTGELILGVGPCNNVAGSIDRVSARAIQPLATRSVLTQNEPEVLARTIEIAAQMADEEITAAQSNAGLVPKISGAHIKKAMEKAGVIVPAPPAPDPEEAAATATEKRRAQREATVTRLDRDIRWMVSNGYSAGARDIGLLVIALLGDKPKMLDDLREALA